jgi:hypothetical protein
MLGQIAQRGTAGIDSYLVKLGAPSGRQHVGGRRCVAKVAEYRVVSAVRVRIESLGTVRMKIVLQF